MKNILVTGAAGFIGANYAELMVKKYEGKYNIIVFDKLTYAGNLHNLDNIKDKITFVQGDICDFDFVMETYKKYNIDAVVHFAAESHVDNSIKNPFVFTHTNVIGTHTLLEAAKQYWGEGSKNRFVHVSTDEVYGTLGEEDHCEAIDLVLHEGKKGERYNIGGHNEKRNIEIVKLILKRLDKPESLISFVTDRKGHDYRYAIDPSKIHSELGWLPKTKFEDGIVKTIDWYLEHPEYLDK